MKNIFLCILLIPLLIEPVVGEITLKNMQLSKRVSITSLNGDGTPAADRIPAMKTGENEWTLSFGKTVTLWYAIDVE